VKTDRAIADRGFSKGRAGEAERKMTEVVAGGPEYWYLGRLGPDEVPVD
jgi:hypothetical protein